jgi:hypothetical protein
MATQPVTATEVVPIGLVGAVGTFAKVVVPAGGATADFETPALIAAALLAAALAAAAFFSVADFADATVVVAVTVPATVVAVVVAVELATVVVVAGVEVAQPDGVIVSESSVTAPFSAKTRPRIVTLVVTVMLWFARIVPTNSESLPSVAELPTCQNTLHAWAPFVRTTWLDEAVVSVLDPAWKTNTEAGFPPPFSVSVPVSPIEEAEL